VGLPYRYGYHTPFTNAHNIQGGGILSGDSTIIPFVLKTSGHIIYDYISHPDPFDGNLEGVL